MKAHIWRGWSSAIKEVSLDIHINTRAIGW
jgi:hypothetical protein